MIDNNEINDIHENVEDEKTDLISDELNNNINNNLNDEKLDLAQMEYNVKQFLLKQNEWSIHNRPLSSNPSSSITSEQMKNIISNENSFVKQIQRTETNL